LLILHVVGRSLVRHTPARIACYWGRYTEHKSVGICLGREGGYGAHREALNPYGWLFARDNKRELQRLVSEADVIHCHDDAYPTMLSNSVDRVHVYQGHIGDIPRRLFRPRRFSYSNLVKHASITNGYGRHFDPEKRKRGVKWGRLGDILDLWHPTYRSCDPGEKFKRFTVVFTYSNTREPGTKINAKGPKAHRELLKDIKGVDVKIVAGIPFEQSMELKRKAHIVLDEVFSPYTHLSALEGAAAGTCVLTNYDDYTVNDLCGWVGAPKESYPFQLTTPQTLRAKVEWFRDHVDAALEAGMKARAWMERWYSPEALLRKYLEFYNAGSNL
jgi:hypothetical protein